MLLRLKGRLLVYKSLLVGGYVLWLLLLIGWNKLVLVGVLVFLLRGAILVSVAFGCLLLLNDLGVPELLRLDCALFLVQAT